MTSSTTTTVVGHPEPKPVVHEGSGLLWAGVAEVVVAVAAVGFLVRWVRRRSA